GDGLERVSVAGARTRLDLAEHQRVRCGVVRDQVELALAAPPVAFHDPPAEFLDVGRGAVLTPSGQLSGPCIDRHSRPPPHHTLGVAGGRACLSTGGGRGYLSSGTWKSECAISSMETSRKVRTLADFTKRAGRYMSHTQASPM